MHQVLNDWGNSLYQDADPLVVRMKRVWLIELSI
jgi:hypothetical protein